MSIRVVTFDALFTLLRPRQPIHLQYARTFEPYFGPLDPEVIKLSFKDGQSSHMSPPVKRTYGKHRRLRSSSADGEGKGA